MSCFLQEEGSHFAESLFVERHRSVLATGHNVQCLQSAGIFQCLCEPFALTTGHHVVGIAMEYQEARTFGRHVTDGTDEAHHVGQLFRSAADEGCLG